MRSEDDLTYKLAEVIKASASVRRCEQEGAPAHISTEFEQLLQVSIMSEDLTRLTQALSSSMSQHTWTMTSAVSRKPSNPVDDLLKPSDPD